MSTIDKVVIYGVANPESRSYLKQDLSSQKF